MALVLNLALRVSVLGTLWAYQYGMGYAGLVATRAKQHNAALVLKLLHHLT